jgi:two-component system, NtrC family, sensor kinase
VGASQVDPNERRFGLRTQILLGLTLVTLFAVLSTGYLTLWAGGSSLRIQRESTVLALATAAAASAAAVLEAEKPPEMSAEAAPPEGTEPEPPATPSPADSRQRLTALARELIQRGDVTQVTILGPERQVLAAEPPRPADDTDPPVVLAILGGTAPIYQYRISETGTDLLAYAPVRVGNKVVAAVRVTVQAPAPTTVVLRRSGWVLLTLAVANALLVLGLGYLVLTRLVVRPLRTMERATARVTAGDWDQAIKPSGPREVVALASAFNQMTASLASQREQLIRTEKLASVGQLAAGVAHEIGNPLAAILGFVDILRSEESGQTPLAATDRRDMLDRIKAETQRIHRTIQDLLDYSRPSRDDAQPTDPLKILKASEGLLEPQKRFRGVRVITLPTESTAWPRVLVSPGRLQQVFVNLLINAADAMDGDGTVTASYSAVGDSVHLSFADTGFGVPPELRRKIFDPFFTTKPPGQGTGLGLAISRSIVESYGGTLDLIQEEGKGATFVVTLPAAQ